MIRKKSKNNRHKSKVSKLLFGGEPRRVLVLCQRRTGMSGKDDSRYRVEDIIIPKINKVIRDILGEDTVITYMSDIYEHQGTVDINCLLDGRTDCSKQFISENINSFDLIIFQTCPCAWMDYNIIHSLLKTNGILGITAFPSEIIDVLSQEMLNKTVIEHIPVSLFVRQESSNTDILTYIKKQGKNGGKYRKQSKRNKQDLM
jgi:hypothetical protein